ncbi:PAAR domain-containing protein [Luteimonas sp. FCS-9]|uniref:PAAR domain-containing protein n=1 Tax=Luteimonas sp. FCS-9 TaxID=1547516 RepID=UPI0009E63607|nr:PAAR domain-containing protein [Luteimonas sp. FCS-9]
MARHLIVVGDPTSGGGVVVSGSPFTDIEGKPVSRINDHATCPKHKGTFPIVTGDLTLVIDGQPVARDGDRLACGCSVLSNKQYRVFIDSGGNVGRAAAGVGGLFAASPAPAPLETPLQASSAPAEEPTTAVTLRIGVFFDGTNNNASNIALGAQCRASSADALGQDAEDRAAIAEHCRPYMLKPGSSYDNGITNVARLYELYEDSSSESWSESDTSYCIPIYVDGIGTLAGEADDLLSQGLGTGRSGVLARVSETMSRSIPEQLAAFVANASGAEVEAIEFDVFGFSRGAAAARHFVHEVNRKGHGPLAGALLGSGVRYTPDFEFVESVSVEFVGLFDSVSAIGSLADGLNVRDGRTGGVQMALPAGCARQVVHLVARDERRANFMLTSADPPHGDIVLPGVHSDIGGGYHRDREGPLLLTKPVGFDEPAEGLAPGQAPDRGQLERSRAFRRAATECARWREQLDADAETVRVEVWHQWQSRRRAGSHSVQPDRALRIYAAVSLERAVDWRYQLIPLRLMHRKASEGGVPWRQSPDDVPDMSLTDELLPLADKLINGQALIKQEEALLRRKYLHQSSHWNYALGRNPVSLELVYASRPDPSGQRNILPNR